MDKMRMESPDLTQRNIEAIAALFPNCITETRGADGSIRRAINFDMLRQMLTDEAIAGDEAYEFTWVGKKAAMVEASRQIRKTLRPIVDKSLEWETTQNLYIEGDNLEVLKLLQESYLGRVDMIYIDPPYNTGHDFIYRDDFSRAQIEEDLDMGAIDEDTEYRLFENQETNGRFHSDWCSMIYSRLLLARNLLSKNGVIAISIGYHELHNLMQMCQEVFGGRQVFCVTVQTSGGKPNGAFNISNEYIIFAVPEGYMPIPTEEDMKEYNTPYHGMNLATFNQIQRPNQAYPIYIDNEGVIIGVGKSIQERIDDGSYTGFAGDFVYDYNEAPNGAVAVWPVTAKGEQCVWRLIPSRLLNDWSKGYIKVIPQKGGATSNAYTIQYLSGGIIDKIISGELETYRMSDNPRIPTLEIKEYKTAGSGIASIWTDNEFYTTKGSNEIRDLFSGKVFSYPKPLALIRYILKRTVPTDGLVMDFFSGSATTAHAVLSLNAEDNGQRRFIMIQLPEQCDEKSDAFKAGYRTICDIGEDRIRLAAQRIRKNSGIIPVNVDMGFRVFTLSSANMKDVYYSAGEYTQSLLSGLESNIKEDRDALDLLFGCLLEWGLPLSLPYTSESISGYTVHTYNDGDLIACFDKNVPEAVVRTIADRHPLRAVFRDSSFASSPERINVEEIFKLLSPNTSVKVL